MLPFWRGVIKCFPYFKLELRLIYNGAGNGLNYGSTAGLVANPCILHSPLYSKLHLAKSPRLHIKSKIILSPSLSVTFSLPCGFRLFPHSYKSSLSYLLSIPPRSYYLDSHQQWTVFDSISLLSYQHFISKKHTSIIMWSASTHIKVKFIAWLAVLDWLPTQIFSSNTT